MTINIALPKSLAPFYFTELHLCKKSLEDGDFQVAWNHLERAHILGQAYPVAHTQVHWEMLKFGFKIKSKKEVLGQIPRLVFGGMKSFIGKIPAGNPGGSNVPPLKSFPIDPELMHILNNTNE